MLQMTVRIDGLDDLQRRLAGYASDLPDKVVSAALNKTGDKAKTEMKRAITDEYNLKSTEVNSRLDMSRANRNNLRVVIDPFASGRKGRALNLIHFLEKKVTLAQARRRAKDGKLFVVQAANENLGKGLHGQILPILYFKIKKNEPAKTILGAFLGNNGRTVFIRTGKARLPIKPLCTIDIPQMFSARKSIDRVMRVIERELPIEIERAITAMLERTR